MIKFFLSYMIQLLNKYFKDSITSDESREDTFPVLMPNSTPLHPLQDLNPSNLNQNLLNDSEIRTYDFKALDNISQSETVEVNTIIHNFWRF